MIANCGVSVKEKVSIESQSWKCTQQSSLFPVPHLVQLTDWKGVPWSWTVNRRLSQEWKQWGEVFLVSYHDTCVATVLGNLRVDA